MFQVRGRADGIWGLSPLDQVSVARREALEGVAMREPLLACADDAHHTCGRERGAVVSACMRGAVVSACMRGAVVSARMRARTTLTTSRSWKSLMRKAISMQSACNQHAISMQSACNLQAISRQSPYPSRAAGASRWRHRACRPPDEGGNPEVLRRNQEAIRAHQRLVSSSGTQSGPQTQSRGDQCSPVPYLA